ncbi:hypothetical protein [Comamonas sp. JC664]|uniref:hypothetical protein n=1 Tax=Comamonas sp. JC664 TaxID=2801917 RepID=UPI00174A8432|nr:hypothetical protein [Comamonas sp. JC664]MBL0698092.1 hypothetical protein [Comamonas sp. JC664]GHG71306.1 hypothetical protein GCM10012319_16980 [Comamonas sp. KCTC 72670]
MNLSPLHDGLRTKVEQRVRTKPELAPLIQSVLDLRAAASSDEERARHDRQVERLIRPSRIREWLGFALVAVIGLLLSHAIYRGRQVERAAAEGTPTTAQVERMEPGSCLIGTKSERCLTLALKLYPALGAPYSASLTQSIPVEWLARVQPGSWLTVAVAPEEPQKVTFDVRTMSVAPPAPPASAQ